MHDIRRLGLQVFAAPNNLTGEVQIEVKAREIDFVTSFGKNLKALLDILGITRMIRKENNSVLKTKTVKGELQSGDVGEGEEIPMSRYTVEEKPFDTIKIEKYRKGVSLEAILEKGYEAAVQDTDDEFKSDLQNVVTDKFYAQLKAGSLTGHETTWQMAVAMAIGKVVAKFQKMKRTATGVAVWVNTLDVYKYLGAADITLQTAFGFKYLTNFLGADVVFVTSEIPQNIVIATPLNNMIAYYVDPGDSEFAKAGLGFTTDSETGFIGFHSEGTYSRMISDNYQFKFGMGFLREANKLTTVPVQGMPGTTKEIGARYLIASVVVDQEPNALVDLLDLANKGENPRVTKAMLDSYIDSEEVDIDELMEKTKDFLSKTNATKKAVKEILKEYEEQMAKKRQAQEQ